MKKTRGKRLRFCCGQPCREHARVCIHKGRHGAEAAAAWVTGGKQAHAALESMKRVRSPEQLVKRARPNNAFRNGNCN